MEPVQVSDFDAFATRAATVARWHAAGQHLAARLVIPAEGAVIDDAFVRAARDVGRR